jgi:CheY-like chemotaxis protein/two-component sensor histidine kinase
VAIARERLQIQEALREADRRKDQFLAMLGHELRNPIAAISGVVELLKRPDAAQRVAMVLDPLERQSRTLVRLVDDLLDASRVSQGKILLRREQLSLNALVQRAVDMMSSAIKARRHTLKLTLPAEELPLIGDATRLEQVVTNLLSNAVKYTDEGGSIHLALSRVGNEAVLRVKDNGIGIPSGKQDEIFELFSQLDQSLHRSLGGLGIGLALVKILLELHGGSVAVHSEGSDQGSEFTVRLPLNMEALIHRPLRSAESGPQTAALPHSLRFLVVDDNPDVLLLLRTILEEHGQQVKTAADGLSAIEAARAWKPDIVLLDIGLPGKNGYEVAKQIRSEPALDKTRLVAVTGYGQDEHRRLAAEAGFHLHLTKPVSFEAIAGLIAAAGTPPS